MLKYNKGNIQMIIQHIKYLASKNTNGDDKPVIFKPKDREDPTIEPSSLETELPSFKLS
jgi:hypothetical protein